MATFDPSQSTLSPNFAPYVYDMLSRGVGAANLPYQPYTGQRYAGSGAVETGMLSGAANMQPYQATTFNTGLGALGSVQDYMSPYMTGVADIAAREARRQADISRQSEQGRLAQAGAYGGSRQAIMEAERQRNLGTQVEDIYTKGLQSAYDRALEQRLKESGLGLEAQKGSELSRQFGAKQGLEALQQQMEAAKYERGVAQQPLDFAYEQFKESQQYPYQQATFLSSLLQGMPVRANPYQYTPGVTGSAAATAGGLAGLDLYNKLFGQLGGK